MRLYYLQKTLEETRLLYSGKTSESHTFRTEINTGRMIIKAAIQKELIPKLLPSSTVALGRSYQVEIFWELGFLTESEVVKACAVSSMLGGRRHRHCVGVVCQSPRTGPSRVQRHPPNPSAWQIRAQQGQDIGIPRRPHHERAH